VVLGLTVCDYCILEEGTRKVSLIGILSKLRTRQFPFRAPQFFVHAALTDGLGDATIDLIVSGSNTGESVYERRQRVHFSDRLRELHVIFRINDCTFPAPGGYLFTLLVDREWVAHRRVRVSS